MATVFSFWNPFVRVNDRTIAIDITQLYVGEIELFHLLEIGEIVEVDEIMEEEEENEKEEENVEEEIEEEEKEDEKEEEGWWVICL